MSLEVEVLELVQNQIEDNTVIRACKIGTLETYGKYPYCNVMLHGGDKGGPDVNGSLDEYWYLTILITARSIKDYYDVVSELKTLWYSVSSTQFQALRQLGTDSKVLNIQFNPPAGFPWQLPLGDNSQEVKGSLSFKLMVRHSY